MRKNKAWLLLLGLLAIAGCKPKQPKFNPSPINEVVAKENNADVELEGVVYAVASNGYFVNDGTASVFVLDNSEVKVGDKLQITAKVAVNNNRAYIKNATVTVAESNQQALTASEFTVEQINALSASDQASYNKYVTLLGTITTDAAGQLVLKSDLGGHVYFASNSNKTALNDKKESRVTLDAVVYQKGTQTGWEVSFCGAAADIHDAEFTFEQLLVKAAEHIASTVPTEFCGALTLPSGHPVFNQITYTWATSDADAAYVAIENNKATVHFDAEDHAVTLNVTITVGENSQTVPYPATSKAVTEVSVGQFVDNMPTINRSVAMVRGIVSGFARNQSRTYQGVIIQDKDEPTKSIQVELNAAQFAEVQLGDEIVACGYWRTVSSGDRPTLDTDANGNLISYEVKSHNNTYSLQESYVVDSEEKMAYFAAHYSEFTAKLIKFVNVKAVWNVASQSKRVSTSYAILGFDKSAYSLNGGTDTKIVLLYQNNVDFTHSAYWADEMGIPYGGEPETLEATFYAYPGYFTSGTIAMLNIAGPESFIPNSVEKNVSIKIASQVVTETTYDDVVLPESVKIGDADVALTWTSDKPEVIATDGKLTAQDETTLVTLTAHFLVEGVEKTYEHKINVIGSKAITVGELFANKAEGDFVKVNGTVIGYQQVGSWSSAGLGRIGYVLLDETTGDVIYTNAAKNIGGDFFDGYKDSAGNDIRPGDSVTVTGIYHVDSPNPNSGTDASNVGRHYIDLGNGTATVVEHNKAMLPTENAGIVTVSSQAELVALFAETIPFNKIIKFVGSEDTPIWFRTHAATWGATASSNNISIAFTDNTDPIKYDSANGGSTTSLYLGFSAQGNDVAFAQLGLDHWYSGAGFNGTEAKYSIRQATGEFYAIIGYSNSTYYHATIVAPGSFNLTPAMTAEDAKVIVTGFFPTMAASGSTYAMSEGSVNGVTDLAWASENTAVIANDGTVATVDADTEVTISVSYKFKGADQNFQVVVTVKAPKTYTVAEVCALTDDLANVRAEGTVISFANDGNTHALRQGLVIADLTTGKTVVVNNFADQTYPTYTDSTADKNLITIGSHVLVKGDFCYKKDPGTATGGSGVECVYITANEVTVTGADTIDWSALPVTTVTNSTELTAALAGDYYTTVIKMVGTADNPIAIGGSSSTAACNYKILFNDKNNTTDQGKYNGKTISIKETTPTWVANDWYSTYFPGVTGRFAAVTKSTTSPYVYTGDLYLVVTHTTGSYYQADMVNPAAWSLTAYTPAA